MGSSIVRRCRFAAPPIVLGLLVVASAPAGQPSVRTLLTSVGPQGGVHASSSTYWGGSVSASGRMAVFTSDGDGLPGADATRDVYVRDHERGKTKLVSRATSGEPVNADAGDDVAISGNGRFVAFTTDADNLPGGVGGVYVRDLRKGKTKLVSRTSAGDPSASDIGSNPGLSANGRFVVFALDDDDFPGADDTKDAYVRDRRKGKTELISQTTAGMPVDTDTFVDPAISGDGRFVAFSSNSDLLPGDDATRDVFIRDREKKTTTLVSRTPAGDPASFSFSYAGSVSADGRFVVFECEAAGIGAAPGGSIYIRDRKLGTTTLASREGGGGVAAGEEASISADGRYVAFTSDDDDLPGADVTQDAYRYDSKQETTALASRANNGDPGEDDSFYVSISGNGAFVAFDSRANNLSNHDDDDYSNAFLRGPLP